jgi:hypothetical protein
MTRRKRIGVLIWFLWISSGLATSASAADFRALDFGQSCVLAPDWEVEHGSTPARAPAGTSGSQLAYTGHEFDRDLYIFYFCVGGKLFSGNYLFPIESPDQIADTYRDAYTKLLSIYGEIHDDDSPMTHGDRYFIEPDLSNFSTIWRTSRVSAILAIKRSRKNEKSGWRVILIVFPADFKAQVPDLKLAKAVIRK